MNDERGRALLELLEKGVAASADALAAVFRTSWSTQTSSINAASNTIADACEDAFFLSAPEMVLDKKPTLIKVALDKLRAFGR